MARAGITLTNVKHARDALVKRGQHPSLDAIRIELKNTGSKSTIQKYMKELEAAEEIQEGRLRGVESLSTPIQTLAEQLATQLQADAQKIVDAKEAAAAIERQQALAEREQLVAELDRLRVQLAETNAALSREQAAHAETRDEAQQRALECERLGQQLRDQIERAAEHEGFRRSLEEKLVHARDALEHFREAAREQRDQEARRHEQQVQQLQAELRQVRETVIVKQNEITHLNKENGRLVSESLAATKLLRETQEHAGRQQEALTQVKVDYGRLEAECTAIRQRLSEQAEDLAEVRKAHGAVATERIELVARLEAQQLLLDDYRTRLGQQGATG
ncbi:MULTISPECIES: DNA-binding protein [Burkholderia cepacia complex]|uniref:Integrase n=1 Tax=Burkholderia stabilis TaxID=95485 RepID=A0AAJ5T971_9BURK|nr:MULTISPECIES: DNA-binding protein [Burkholderia cepacia complex]MBR8290498.1 DNA-binding protein [Burkholderia cenocepacia]ONU69326.1 integrase [Burkholderia cenocepacia]ONU94841.1 integrase [Burkholderia cenocepacia]VBB17446.1 integrase [Burkholderia stabilis]